MFEVQHNCASLLGADQFGDVSVMIDVSPVEAMAFAAGILVFNYAETVVKRIFDGRRKSIVGLLVGSNGTRIIVRRYVARGLGINRRLPK